MKKDKFIEITPFTYDANNIVLETYFPNDKKEIKISINNNKIILESTTQDSSSFIDNSIIDRFNILKNLGEELYNELDLITNNYTLLIFPPNIYSNYDKIKFSEYYYLFKPYLNEKCIIILKEYFIKYGYPYIPSNDLINLSKLNPNDYYTFELDITLFVYFCISIYIISDTYFYILHNKEKKIKKLLPLYIIDNSIPNERIMNLCTNGIMNIINDIEEYINHALLSCPIYSTNRQNIVLNYYENLLKKNYKHNSQTNEYIDKNNNIMKRKENKLIDTYYIDNYTYNEYKPLELLSTLIIMNKQSYNNILIPVYDHLKNLLSNASKSSGYHYCKICHNSFFGIGKECDKCKSLIPKENKKKVSDNRRYENIANTYKEFKNLKNINKEEKEYINNITTIKSFRNIYTKNKDKTKIDNMISKG